MSQGCFVRVCSLRPLQHTRSGNHLLGTWSLWTHDSAPGFPKTPFRGVDGSKDQKSPLLPHFAPEGSVP